MTSLLRYNLDSLTSRKKGKAQVVKSSALILTFFVSLVSHVSLFVLLVVVYFNMDAFQRNFGFSSVRFDIILLLLYMTTSATDDAARLVFNPLLHLHQYMAQTHISHLMILLQHRIFPGQLE